MMEIAKVNHLSNFKNVYVVAMAIPSPTMPNIKNSVVA